MPSEKTKDIRYIQYMHMCKEWHFFSFFFLWSWSVGNEEITALLNSHLKGAMWWNVMTWLAELKPNTALNHRGVVDGSRERKGARRQRFLIQINTELRLSSKSLLSNIDYSNSQWLFQHSLGWRLAADSCPPFWHSKHFPYFLLLSWSPFLLFINSPCILPFWSHLFTASSLTVSHSTTSPGHQGAHS